MYNRKIRMSVPATQSPQCTLTRTNTTSEDHAYLVARGWRETEIGWFGPRDLSLKMERGWTLAEGLEIQQKRTGNPASNTPASELPGPKLYKVQAAG